MTKKTFHLREISYDDWEILLEWRNEKETRNNSINSNIIQEDEHKDFIKKIIKDSEKNQFIFEYNEKPVGTIREDLLGEDQFELSYTINPKYRGMKIGQIMMHLYLIERKGSFFCEVKEKNTPSIKMIEKLGFKLYKKDNHINLYKLDK